MSLQLFIFFFRYQVSRWERPGVFLYSQSYGPDMTVEFVYRDTKIYKTQRVSVEYEFLDNDKIAALKRSS